jgi:pantoate--beta-alanine ligase
MRTVRTVAELRLALAPARRDGLTIGLVPTMGALHEGHLSLVTHARERCDVVVVSLFVNPAQFNERADLERYPRDERRDAELAAAAGADVLFAPSVEEVYPAGFATSVEVLGVTERLEGAARGAAHFRGVSTVVTKLLCMAMPDVAYFGQKDAQQVVVIRRLARDLDLPVRIEALPTVREPDGLAMSSRNALLTPDERERARALPAALEAARALAASGERSAQALLDAAHTAMRPFGVEPEYLALVEPDTLEPVDTLKDETLLALAARIGEIRLIDNAILTPVSQPLEGGAIATCNA